MSGHAKLVAVEVGGVVGPQVGVLDRVVEQLDLYTSGGGVDVEAVEALVTSTRVRSVFELTDAVGERRLDQATLRLRELLGGGENALMVLAMLARQFRQLLKVKAHTAERGPKSALVKALGVPPMLVESLQRQAERYSERELETALGQTPAVDLAVKASRLPAHLVLERWLLDVMGSAR